MRVGRDGRADISRPAPIGYEATRPHRRAAPAAAAHTISRSCWRTNVAMTAYSPTDANASAPIAKNTTSHRLNRGRASGPSTQSPLDTTLHRLWSARFRSRDAEGTVVSLAVPAHVHQNRSRRRHIRAVVSGNGRTRDRERASRKLPDRPNTAIVSVGSASLRTLLFTEGASWVSARTRSS